MRWHHSDNFTAASIIRVDTVAFRQWVKLLGVGIAEAIANRKERYVFGTRVAYPRKGEPSAKVMGHLAVIIAKQHISDTASLAPRQPCRNESIGAVDQIVGIDSAP